MSCVLPPHLFLGDVNDALEVASGGNKLGVTRLLTVSRELAAHIHPPEHVHHMVIEVDDHPDVNLTQYFKSAIAFIDEGLSRNENTLVHCFAGISRSSTIVLAYFLNIYPWMSVNSALDVVRSIRPIVNPNPGFMLQLRKYEDSLNKDFISGQVACD